MPTRVYTASRQPIQLDRAPLATPGAEGSVYCVHSVGSLSDSCAKIYHRNKITQKRKDKIHFMIHNQPHNLITQNYIVCWPSDMIFDSRNKFVGFIMPLAFSGSEELYELSTPKISPRLSIHWSKFDRTKRVGIEKRL